MTDLNINSHYLKLQGKAELPEAIEMGHNYEVKVSGSVTSTTLHDNEDGTYDKMYTFRPVKVDTLTPLGKTLKLKDTRRNSEKFRFACKREWEALNTDMSFDDFYNAVSTEAILYVGTLAEQALDKIKQRT